MKYTKIHREMISVGEWNTQINDLRVGTKYTELNLCANKNNTH